MNEKPEEIILNLKLNEYLAFMKGDLNYYFHSTYLRFPGNILTYISATISSSAEERFVIGKTIIKDIFNFPDVDLLEFRIQSPFYTDDMLKYRVSKKFSVLDITTNYEKFKNPVSIHKLDNFLPGVKHFNSTITYLSKMPSVSDYLRKVK